MPESPGIEEHVQIGLAEQVSTVGRIVVRGDRHAEAVRLNNPARIHVLIELVVRGKPRTVAERQALAEPMLESDGQPIHGDARQAVLGVPEER